MRINLTQPAVLRHSSLAIFLMKEYPYNHCMCRARVCNVVL